MTNEEAIMKMELFQDIYEPPKDFAEAFDKAIEALKKQIPIEPKLDKYGDMLCPKCGEIVDWLHFCWECGQAISWEE